MVDLVRGAARPLHLAGGIRRTSYVRRRSRPGDARVSAARRRHPEGAAVHEVLPGAPRPVAVAADGSHPARARALPAQRPVLDLQLRLLGAADVRGSLARAVAAARSTHRRRPANARRDPREDARVDPARPAAPSGAEASRGMDPGAAGGGRIVGRHPAALGVGDHRPRRAGSRRRARRHHAPGGRWLAGIHGRRRRPPAPRGVPVAGVGHRARRARAPRVRRAGRPPSARRRRRVSPAPAGDAQGRLVDPGAGPRSRWLGLRVRERPLSRRRRRGRRRPRAARARARRGRRRARRRLARGHAVARRVAGERSTSTTRRCGSTRSRSATSAR